MTARRTNHVERAERTPVFVSRRGCVRCSLPCVGWACLRCVENGLLDTTPSDTDDLATARPGDMGD